ncbi:MAG: SRPBCC family protein [Pseudonocardiaceae bacterium]
MLIESEFEVAAPLEAVWDHLLDVPKIAPCMPGAELTEVVGDGVYKGRLLTKMGPVSLSFAGTAQIVEQDSTAKKIVMKASGAEEKGKGQAEMTVTSTLERSGTGTKVNVAQDIQIAGALAQYGRGMISDVTSVLMRSFAACIQDNINRESRGEAPAQRGAAPVKGFTVGLQATLLALKRFFRRLFGGGSG